MARDRFTSVSRRARNSTNEGSSSSVALAALTTFFGKARILDSFLALRPLSNTPMASAASARFSGFTCNKGWIHRYQGGGFTGSPCSPATRGGFPGTRGGFTGSPCSPSTRGGFPDTRGGFTASSGSPATRGGFTGTRGGFTGSPCSPSTRGGFTSTRGGFTGSPCSPATRGGFTGTRGGFTASPGSPTTRGEFTGTRGGVYGSPGSPTTRGGFTGVRVLGVANLEVEDGVPLGVGGLVDGLRAEVAAAVVRRPRVDEHHVGVARVAERAHHGQVGRPRDLHPEHANHVLHVPKPTGPTSVTSPKDPRRCPCRQPR
eukprot:1181346-Prorocentrum_minimum.AAC.1